jgi:hypothetical protein
LTHCHQWHCILRSWHRCNSLEGHGI